MLVGDYKRMAFDPALVGHNDRRLRRLVEEAQMYRGVGALPPFMQDISLHDVMTEHYELLKCPS